jgi:hypothetical protein
MCNPFSRRRRRTTSAETEIVRVVDLVAPGVALHGSVRTPVTTINRPDSLSPVDHPMPFPTPNQADLRLLVTQKIDELAAAGSLDGGSAAVLDHWIDEMQEEWTSRIATEAHSRRTVAAILYGVDVEDITRESERLRTLRQQLAEAQAQKDWLHGHVAASATAEPIPPGAADGTASWPEVTVPALPTCPELSALLSAPDITGTTTTETTATRTATPDGRAITAELA